MANLNEARPRAIKVTLNDGIERELKFTLNAMAELEDAYGSVDAAFEALEKKNSIKALRKVLWAGLLHEENPMTETQVGEHVDLAYMAELVESLNSAMDVSLPAPETGSAPAIAASPNSPTA